MGIRHNKSGIEELNPKIYRYDQIRIHVATETKVESLNIDQVNLGFTIALFGFSWIGYAFLAYEVIREEYKKKEEYQIIININNNPDTNKTAPITNTDNISIVSRLPKKENQNNESKKEHTKNNPAK